MLTAITDCDSHSIGRVRVSVSYWRKQQKEQ